MSKAYIKIRQGAGAEAGLVWLTLSRPEGKNALSWEMTEQLVSCLQEIRTNSLHHVLILEAEGNVFCAGGDTKEMQNGEGMFKGSSQEISERYAQSIQQIPRMMDLLEIPVIASIQGPAVGAGMDLCNMCDFRVMSSVAYFQSGFVHLSLISGDGGAYFLTRNLGVARALEVYLLGRNISAEEAYRVGMVTEVCAPAELKLRTQALALELLSKPKSSLKLLKRSVREACTSQLDGHLKQMSLMQGLLHHSTEHQAAMKKKR